MIHTATLTYSPTKELFQSFIMAQGVRYDPRTKRFILDKYKSNGIVLFAFETIKQTYHSYALLCRINFKRLIETGDRIATFAESDTDAVAASFDAIMAKISPDMPPFFEWNVNRIDYCVNVRTPYVAEYLRLLKKSDMPHYFRARNGNHYQRSGSLYLVCDSVTVNFYDKQDQLRHEQKTNVVITNSMIAQAQDVLRVEVQCHRARTNYIKFKYDMDAKTIGYFLSDAISMQVLLSTLDRIAPHADYQRRGTALLYINVSRFSERKKRQLRQLIADISRQHASIWKVRQQYENDGILTKNTFNQYLRTLKSMNINAVTISDNHKLTGKTLSEGLPSLQDVLLDAIAHEIDTDEDNLELELDEN